MRQCVLDGHYDEDMLFRETIDSMFRNNRLADGEDNIKTTQSQPVQDLLRRIRMKNGFHAGTSLAKLFQHEVKKAGSKRFARADAKSRSPMFIFLSRIQRPQPEALGSGQGNRSDSYLTPWLGV